MGRIKRGGYMFVTWKGDHMPRHVHIYEGSTEIARFNLESFVTINGKVSRKILKIIKELIKKGLL